MAFPETEGFYIAEGGLEVQRQVAENAIEQAASQFNFFIRGIARKRLRDSNPVYPDINLDYQNQSLSLSSGADQLKIDGDHLEKFPFVTPKGLKVQVDQFVGPDKAKRVFHSKDGRREVVYRLTDKNTLLLVDIAIHSPSLYKPMSYQLRYRLNP